MSTYTWYVLQNVLIQCAMWKIWPNVIYYHRVTTQSFICIFDFVVERALIGCAVNRCNIDDSYDFTDRICCIVNPVSAKKPIPKAETTEIIRLKGVSGQMVELMRRVASCWWTCVWTKDLRALSVLPFASFSFIHTLSSVVRTLWPLLQHVTIRYNTSQHSATINTVMSQRWFQLSAPCRYLKLCRHSKLCSRAMTLPHIQIHTHMARIHFQLGTKHWIIDWTKLLWFDHLVSAYRHRQSQMLFEWILCEL